MKKLKTVLLVDDDPINNYINTRLIKKLGITDEVETASNGEEAIQCLHDHCFKTNKLPELIFLDINMPGMNGFEFMEKFISINFVNKEHIIVAALTTSTYPGDKEKMEKLGVNYFLTKPLTEEKVLSFFKKID